MTERVRTMDPRTGHEAPKHHPDEARPASPPDGDEDDGDMATPKRDRDDEADAFDKD